MNAGGRRVPLYGWLTAQAITLLGTRVSMIAIPWLVLTTTGSPTQTGLVAFAEIAPMVLFKAFGGPLVDRIGPRRVAINTDLLSFVVVGLIPLLHHTGVLTFPVLLGLVALAGALRGPGDAATTALIPALVERAAVPYERATGLSSAIERGATMLGAAIAGGLVATVGAANAVAVDATSFALCALVLITTTRSLTHPTPESTGQGIGPSTPEHAEREDGSSTREPAGWEVASSTADPSPQPGERGSSPSSSGPTTSYFVELREGWTFLRRDPVLVSLCVMVAVTNLLDLAWSAVLLPVWAHDSGAGVGAVGLIFAVWGGASMLGSVIAAAYGTRLPRFATYLVAFLITGLPRFLLFALGVPVWAILLMCVIGGVSSGFLNPVLGAVQFERIPRPMVGRVTALTSALSWSLMPLGGVLGGLVISGIGLSPAMLVIGLAYFAATMAPALIPSFRGMNRQEREPVAA
ncbi:MFS transporter [Kribbella sp. NPDC051952]|uniref:MFS transporter n=1 Tax=Kribbella sp. NPDC051952 TaxID=3154851 RepID=UPI003429AC0B